MSIKTAVVRLRECLLAELIEIDLSTRKYAVIGLPCHNHGLREAIEVDPVLQERIVAVFGTYCGAHLNQ